MILLQFDPDQVIVQRAGNTPVKYPSSSECLAALVDLPTKEAITVVYPCAGSIPSSPIEPLTGQLVKMMEASLSFLPEWNTQAFEMIEGLLPLVERQPILVAFDDHLFRDLPQHSRFYALPFELSQRYPRHGNDGLAHDWAFQQIRDDLKNDPLITIHLQGRPTLAAFRGGKVVDMSTGYSPLDGLPGSTTCGTIDPSLPIMLASSGRNLADIRTELAKRSGWQTIPIARGDENQFTGEGDWQYGCFLSRIENALLFWRQPV